MEAARRIIKRARTLRRAMTAPERRLWAQLRDSRLDGLKFRRQHPVGPYVLDFYCDGSKLAVEVDGWGHNMGDQPARDVRRDAWLADHGVRTIRFTAAQVLVDLDTVLIGILAEARR